MSTTASMTSSLHFEFGGTPGSSITEGTAWVSADIKDINTGNCLSIYTANNTEALQAMAREFMHVANALFRMSLDKEGSEYDKGLPATDINAYPELEVAAAMEVEF